MKQKYFTFPIRVYYAETDAGGVVYHGNYLKYMDMARTEWLLSIGINLNTWAKEQAELFVVKKVEIEYLKPAQLLDDLLVISSLQRFSKARMTFLQKITRQGEVLSSATIEIVCIHQNTLRPTRFPEKITQWHAELS